MTITREFVRKHGQKEMEAISSFMQKTLLMRRSVESRPNAADIQQCPIRA